MSTREELQKKEFLIKILVKMKEKRKNNLWEKISKDIYVWDFFSKKIAIKCEKKFHKKRKAKEKIGIEKIGEGEKKERENKKIKKSCGT